jgi:hypothetical protein
MEFSVTEASLAGFRLIGRRPVSALVWALAWIVLGYGAMGLLLLWAAPQLSEAVHAFPQPGGDPEAMGLAMMQFYGGFLRVFWPWGLWAWILITVLQAALYRAILEPKNSGFGYLRLGGDELRLALLQVILGILFVVYIIAVCVACGAVFLAARQLAQPWLGLADAAAVIVAFCLTIYVVVRLMLAQPMTFARKRLQIFDSWGVTRGRFWPLLGVLVLTMIFAAVVGFAFALIRNTVMIGPMQDMMRDAFTHPGDPTRMFSRMLELMNPRTLSPAIVALLLLQGLGDTLTRIVTLSPFAECYRVLTAPPEPGGPVEGMSVYEPAPAPVPDDPGHDDHGHADPHDDSHGRDDGHGH